VEISYIIARLQSREALGFLRSRELRINVFEQVLTSWPIHSSGIKTGEYMK